MNIPLTRIERRWAHAIFETVFPAPPRGELPLGVADMDLDGFLDAVFAQVPFESGLGLRAAIWFVGLAPIFALHRAVSFIALDVEDRERLIVTLLASRIYVVRSLVIAFKAIGALHYCGNLTVRARVLAGAPLVVLRAPPKPAVLATSATAKGADHERSFS